MNEAVVKMDNDKLTKKVFGCDWNKLLAMCDLDGYAPTLSLYGYKGETRAEREEMARRLQAAGRKAWMGTNPK